MISVYFFKGFVTFVLDLLLLLFCVWLRVVDFLGCGGRWQGVRLLVGCGFVCCRGRLLKFGVVGLAAGSVGIVTCWCVNIFYILLVPCSWAFIHQLCNSCEKLIFFFFLTQNLCITWHSSGTIVCPSYISFLNFFLYSFFAEESQEPQNK